MSTADRETLTRAICAVTDLWAEPLDDVHDVPQIVNAVLAALSDHDRQVAAQAWDEGRRAGYADGTDPCVGLPPRTHNPYRADSLAPRPAAPDIGFGDFALPPGEYTAGDEQITVPAAPGVSVRTEWGVACDDDGDVSEADDRAEAERVKGHHDRHCEHGHTIVRREVTDWTPDLGITVTDGGA